MKQQRPRRLGPCPIRARCDRCLDEFGISYVPLLCLVAVVARWVAEGQAATRIDVNFLVQSVDGVPEAAQHLLALKRRRFLEEVTVRQGRRYYKPTSLGLSKVLTAIGRSEIAA